KMLTFEFDALDQLENDAKRREKDHGGVECKVTKLKLEKDRWSIQVSVTLPQGGPEFETYQSWVVNNELTLRQVGGNQAVTTTSYSLDLSTSTKALVTYHFPNAAKLGKPSEWKFLYRTPASIVALPVKFSFENLPLP